MAKTEISPSGSASNRYEPPSFSDAVVNRELSDKNLLVVAHQYSWFVKEQVDRLSQYFNEIHIFARANRITKLGHVIGHDKLKNLSPENRIANESPPNVVVHTTPLTYLPLDMWYRYLGKQHYYAVKRQLSNIDIDFSLIHSHFSWTAGYVGTRLSEYLQIPNITTVHENENRLTSEIESENSLIYEGWEKADALIRVNRKDCDRLSEFNDTIYHIPNGFSRERYPLIQSRKAKDQLNIDPDTKLVFTLTMLNSRKNVSMLIDAVDQMEISEPVYCAIGGRGSEQSHLQTEIDETDTDNQIELLGFVPEDEVHLWMNACDIFTLTSNSEGNPTVMFEALGCGKPFVGTAVGGVGEVIESDEYGLLCEAGDVASFCENLEIAINSEWDRNKIVEYSRQFTWQQISRQVCDVFVESLNHTCSN
jgi:glycosyltransferase involved in cell wall biosynthesis